LELIRISHRFSRLVTAAILVVSLAQAVLAQSTSPVPLPSPFTPIIDYANVIDASTRQRLESTYRNLKERSDIEFAVVTVPTTGDQDIFDYSLAVARGLGIGSSEGEKNGFLLLVAINDRKYFTQVSRHLEGDLPDGVVGQIQRERLVPQFKRQNYSQGIYDTVQSYLATLAVKRNIDIAGIDKSYAYRQTQRQDRETRSSRNPLGNCGILILILVFLILVWSSSRGGRGGGGCLQALLLANLFSNLGSGRGSLGDSGSGWSGGGFGGSGGDSGGFGGGFGGGGDFGGGGAGGSW
jgi:uncharacterized protein